MNTETFMEMMNLRRCGFTYQEIGNRMGVSRQYVYQCIGKRFRGDLNNIKRVNLREFFRKTSMSIPTFTRAVFGCVVVPGIHEQSRVNNFLAGKASHFRVEDFIRMCELTGLTIKEIAELDGEYK